jgi:hypothetical protein
MGEMRRLKVMRMQKDLEPTAQEMDNIKEELERFMKLDKTFKHQEQQEKIGVKYSRR